MAPTEWPTERIRLDLIDPNPWNPNRMSEETMAKLRRSVEDEGMGILGHIVVRPRKKGRYELVDGEHRLRIYQEMGLEDAEAIVADLDDDKAKVAGLVLNELRGRPSLPELGKVLGDLAASRPVADLAKVLPWREGVIKNLAVTYGGLQEEAPEVPSPPKLSRNAVQIRQGDVREVLKRMKPKTVQTVVTSPPYWGLRDFSGGDSSLEVDWEDGWHGQLGLESTPEVYVDHIVEVFRAVRRVLRDDGTAWVNMGDLYSGAIGSSNFGEGAGAIQRPGYGKQNAEQKAIKIKNPLPAKNLLGMPWRVAFGLQADGWWLRSDIIWSKPNPMPGSAKDRPTRAHEYVFLLARRKDYFYDQEAVREEATYGRLERNVNMFSQVGDAKHNPQRLSGIKFEIPDSSTGRNRRSVWEIPTQAYPEAHFATFPEALVEPCVEAGTSEAGCCVNCGMPWARIVEASGGTIGTGTWDAHVDEGPVGSKRYSLRGESNQETYVREDHGFYQACKCDGAKRRPCLVLDPFAGSGTVGVVALRLGRRFLGVELKEEYVALAERRIAEAARADA